MRSLPLSLPGYCFPASNHTDFAQVHFLRLCLNCVCVVILTSQMAVIISMLRGVNVGGHNQIKMEALRALYEQLGMQDPRTYVQSGNVVFRTKERDLRRLTKLLEDGIERSFGFRPDVILRTASELRTAIANN